MEPPSGNLAPSRCRPLRWAAWHGKLTGLRCPPPLCVCVCVCALICLCGLIKSFLWPQSVFPFLFTTFLSNPRPQALVAELLPRVSCIVCCFSLRSLRFIRPWTSRKQNGYRSEDRQSSFSCRHPREGGHVGGDGTHSGRVFGLAGWSGLVIIAQSHLSFRKTSPEFSVVQRATKTSAVSSPTELPTV